jgi:Mrp family chromosome partitioning ATPase
MKPVPFDLTPLAQSFETPVAVRQRKETSTAVAERERVGVFPPHFSLRAGWLTNLAQEQVHALATHILARHTEQGLRSVAVTSAIAGEGKTTLAIAVAERLALADKRVLVIDLDTYRGALSRAAHLKGMAGAIETSASRNGSVPFHAYPTNRAGVYIMPTGRGHEDNGSMPLLSPKGVATVVNRGLEEFDLVLLDCPPLMPVAETHVIGASVDSAILVVRAGKTPNETLDQALREFGKEKFFAAVLNRARPSEIPYFREVYGYYRRD